MKHQGPAESGEGMIKETGEGTGTRSPSLPTLVLLRLDVGKFQWSYPMWGELSS